MSLVKPGGEKRKSALYAKSVLLWPLQKSRNSLYETKVVVMKRYHAEIVFHESVLGDTVKYDDVRPIANEIHAIAELVISTDPDHLFIHDRLNMIVKQLLGEH